MRRHLVLPLALVLGLACGDDPSLVGRARAAIEDDPPASEVLQLALDEPCRIAGPPEVEGERLELVGSATARYGDDGDRYHCAWTGDLDGPANVRFEVVLLESSAAYARYERLVATRAGNEVVATDAGDVAVATSAGVTTSVLLVPDERAGVHLVVEPVDGALVARWGARDHAELLLAM